MRQCANLFTLLVKLLKYGQVSLDVMSNTKYTRFAIFVISAAILGSTAMIVNPGRMAYAQDNATATVDSEGIIKSLKAKHAALSALGEDGDRELLSKIKDMDAKEAGQTALALNIIRALQEYRAVEEAP